MQAWRYLKLVTAKSVDWKGRPNMTSFGQFGCIAYTALTKFDEILSCTGWASFRITQFARGIHHMDHLVRFRCTAKDKSCFESTSTSS